ncbi:MAG TPA: DUF5683 domain-containing protein [Bacteroidales bacterium]|nr:DUF5683 domain-containing protein [Bacteroidales bacterium]
MFSTRAIRKSLSHILLACLLTAGLITFPGIGLTAQTSADSVRFDSVAQANPDTVIHHHSPQKAVIYSLICPGLGQVYNKKYWKIPFIYGAGGAFLYYITYNQTKYKKFRNALFENPASRPDDVFVIDGYPYKYSTLPIGRDYYRRYRDLSIAGFAAIYLLNVIDAMVDATFFEYDISDDLSMKVEPAVIQNIGTTGITASLGLRINIGF